MTDEAWTYYADIREKKKTATGARHLKRGSRSKKCTLPNEHLSRKEIEKMNGEVTTVKLNEPMSYAAFKCLSKNLQEEYLNHLINKYGGTLTSISTDIFGKAHHTLSHYVKKMGLAVDPVGRRTGLELMTWEKFVNKKSSVDSIAHEVLAEVAGGSVEDSDDELTKQLVFGKSTARQSDNKEAPWGTEIRPMVDSVLEFDFTLDQVTDWGELSKLISRLEGISLEGGYRITLRVQRSGD